MPRSNTAGTARSSNSGNMSINYQDSSYDLFGGMNFNEVLDPNLGDAFESRLAQDFPVLPEPETIDPPPETPIQEVSHGQNQTDTLQEPTISPELTLDFIETASMQSLSLVDNTELLNVAQPTVVPQNILPNLQNDFRLDEQQFLQTQLANNPLLSHQQPYRQTLPQPLARHPLPTLEDLIPQYDSLSYQYPEPPQQPALPNLSVLPNIPALQDLQVLANLPNQAFAVPDLPNPQSMADTRRPSNDPRPLQRSRHSKEPPALESVTTSPPIRREKRNPDGQPLSNEKIPRRTHVKMGPGPDPELYYGPSPPKPKSWGPKNDRDQHLFSYTDKGELTAGLFLSAKEMRQYLLGPSRDEDDEDFDGPYRLPGVKYVRKKIRQGLTLWIGWPAAMSNARYPRGGESTKCRFKACRYAHTINVGEPWVIMDERQNVDGEYINPFHNAGYCHLFCLEYYFDLIELWHCIDIRPDFRTFKRESHPYFNLEFKKLQGIGKVIKKWWKSAYADWQAAASRGEKRQRGHGTSLAQCLVEYKLGRDCKAKVKYRQNRAGADISKHRGDPELWRQLTAYKLNGLLDEDGNPVPDAEAKLEAIELSKRLSKRKSQLNNNPVFAARFSPPPSPSHQGTAPPYQPDLIPATTAGQKRSLYDDTLEAIEAMDYGAEYAAMQTGQGTPLLKRQRLEALASADLQLTNPDNSLTVLNPGTQPHYRAQGTEAPFGAHEVVPDNRKSSYAPNIGVDDVPALPSDLFGDLGDTASDLFGGSYYM